MRYVVLKVWHLVWGLPRPHCYQHFGDTYCLHTLGKIWCRLWFWCIGGMIWWPSEMVFATSPSSSLLLLILCIRASALLLKVWGMALLVIQKCKLLHQFMVSYFSCCMDVSPFTVCGECFLLYRLWKLKCPSIRQRTRGKGSALSHLNLNKLSRNCSNHQSNPLMARR